MILLFAISTFSCWKKVHQLYGEFINLTLAITHFKIACHLFQRLGVSVAGISDVSVNVIDKGYATGKYTFT